MTSKHYNESNSVVAKKGMLIMLPASYQNKDMVLVHVLEARADYCKTITLIGNKWWTQGNISEFSDSLFENETGNGWQVVVGSRSKRA